MSNSFCARIKSYCENRRYCPDIWSRCPKERGLWFSKAQKKWLPTFSNLTGGHKFEVMDFVRLPEGQHAWCVFCGGRLKRYIEVERDDGRKYKVGETCLEKVGLVFTPHVLEKLETDKKGKKKDTSSEIYDKEKEQNRDKEIEELLKDVFK